MRKHIHANALVNENFQKYLEKFCSIVTSTMGPFGTTVIIENGSAMPVVTKDGVTVARKLQSLDKVENMVFNIAKQASLETLKAAGDGTTSTAAILLGLSEAYDCTNDKNPNKTVRELKKAVKETIERLHSMTKKASPEIISEIIKTSSNGDEEIVNVMSEAFTVSQHVNVSEYPSNETYVEAVDGFEIETKLLDNNLQLVKPTIQYILITNEVSRSVSLEPIISQLEKLSKEYSYSNILWVHNKMDNKLFSEVIRRTRNVYPITIDGVGAMASDYLHDLATYTGAKVHNIGDDISLTECKFTVGKRTIIKSYNYNKGAISARISDINDAIKYVESEYVKGQYRKRIAKLQGKTATIHFKGRTESAFKELLDRADDAVRAVQSTLASGVVPGGATTYARLGLKTDNRLLKYALLTPYYILLESGGITDHRILADATTGEETLCYSEGNMVDLETGGITTAVYDPALVIESAITNAVSAFSTLITTKHAMIYVADEAS